MTSRKRSRPDSDDESKEGGKGKVGGDTITTFIRNTFNVRLHKQSTPSRRPLLVRSLCRHHSQS